MDKVYSVQIEYGLNYLPYLCIHYIVSLFSINKTIMYKSLSLILKNTKIYIITFPLFSFSTKSAQEGQLDCLIWLNKYTRSVKIKTSVEKMNPALVAAQEGRLDCLRYLARVEREQMKMSDRNGFNVIHYGEYKGGSRHKN